MIISQTEEKDLGDPESDGWKRYKIILRDEEMGPGRQRDRHRERERETERETEREREWNELTF